MPHSHTIPPRPFKGFVLLCLVALGMLAVPMAPTVAQETFMTQSGGRGLQNAKTNARLSKAEKDVGDLQTELAKVKPHAKEDILKCIDSGAKLRWDGSSWNCDQETDPTVQRWAKEALPACSAGSLLSVQGGNFTCNTSGFVSAEVDPTVQNFAKSPLPLCGTGDLLAVGADGNLSCKADEKGLTVETDPLVHDFARTDKVATVQNCAAGEVLKMVNSRLACVVDEKGITAEVDPFVQDFGRKDIAGYNLLACAAGEILTSIDSAGKVILKCTAGGDALGEALDLDDLRDVAISSAANDEVLRYNGTQWVNSNDKIGNLVNGGVCTSNGTEISCSQGAPTSCGPGEYLVFDGTNWNCENAASTLAPTIKLEDLADVTLTTPQAGHVLTWDAINGGWINQEKFNISYGNSEVRVVDSLPAGTGMVQLIPDGMAILTATQGKVGIRTNSPTYDLDVNGTGRVASNMIVGGNLTVGGSVSFTGSLNVEGVTFADGGLQVSGTLASNRIAAAEGTITSLTSQDVSVTRNQTVGGDVHIGGNLFVSGSQTFDGVTFANGGIQVSGTLSSNNIAAAQGTIVSLTSQDISVTRNMTVAGGLSAAGIGVTNLVAGTVTATNLTATNDVHIGGNLFVSGSQTFDGVTFANGGIQVSGTLSSNKIAAAEGTIVSLTAQDVSVTRNQTVAGQLAMGSGIVTNDFTVLGNLKVSGSQTIDGVIFANGGVSATGGISATYFTGDGSRITGVTAASTDRVVSGTTRLLANNNGSISISTAGVERMVIGADGKVGVGDGVAVPAWAAMSVSGTLAANNFRAYDGQGLNFGDGTTRLEGDSIADYINFVTNNTEKMRLTSNGYLGVNTANPNAEVDVVGRVSATNISVSNIITANGAQFTTLAANSAGLGQVAMTSATVTGDLRVGGNFYVSGSQSIDGVVFANGGVSATGTVSATRFSGDGSGLTNLGAGDRIVSGTTSLVANGNGYISLTTSGVNTGYFDTLGRLVLPGLNVTTMDGISSTNGFYSNRLMIGANMPENDVSASGRFLSIYNDANTGTGVDSANAIVQSVNRNANFALVSKPTGTSSIFFRDTSVLNGVQQGAIMYNHVVKSLQFNTSNTTAMTITSDSRVGIGTNAPTAALQVSGTVRGNKIALRDDSIEQWATNGSADLAMNYWGYNGGNTQWRNLSVYDGKGGATPILYVNGQNHRVGINTTNPSLPLEVNGAISATDLRLSGNLYVSGSQSIDGVVFANGGVSATGAVTATSFYGDGSGLTNLGAGDRIVSGTSSVRLAQNQSMTIATAGTDRVVVGSNGRVGIGVANPGSMLHVSGVSNSTGGLTFGTPTGDRMAIYPTGNLSMVLRMLIPGGSMTFADTSGTNMANFANDTRRLLVGPGGTAASTLQTVGVSDSTGGLTIGTPTENRLAMYSSGNFSASLQLLQSAGVFSILNNSGATIASFNNNSRTTIMGMAGTPSSTLHVVGVSDSTGGITVGTSTENRLAIYPAGNQSAVMRIMQSNANLTLQNSTAQNIALFNGNSQSMILGNTISGFPSSTLHVVGVSDSTGGITVGTATEKRLAIYGQYTNSAALEMFQPGVLAVKGPSGDIAAFDTSKRGMYIGGPDAPSTTLQVSGTIRISNGGEACDGNRTGGIRYAAGVFEFCDAGAVWKSIGALAGAAGIDRIVSGTTSVIANQTGYISLTTGGVNTGYFDMAGVLVAPGISTTATASAAIYDNLVIRQQSNNSGSGLHLYSPGLATGRLYMNATSFVMGRGSTPTIVINNGGDKVIINASNSSGMTPSSTLHIIGVSDSTGGLTIGTATEKRLSIYPYATVSAGMKVEQSGGNLYLMNSSNLPIARFTDSQRTMLGSSYDPSETLHVIGNAKVSGTIQIAGTGAETCGAGDYGRSRFVDTGGGTFKMQACRP